MAGIGFRIRNIVQNNSFYEILKAYGYAGATLCGPWLLSISVLMVISWLGQESVRNMTFFFQFITTITYTISISLILTGPMQLVLARYAADNIFTKNGQMLFPALISSLLFVQGLSAIIGLSFFMPFGVGPVIARFSAVFLLILFSSIWICVIYISIFDKYEKIIYAFLVGYGSSCILTFVALHAYGKEMAIVGFVLGQFLLFFMLFGYIAKSLKYGEEVFNFNFLDWFAKYKWIPICGLFYYLGIWIDKILFWYLSEDKMHIGGAIFACPAYDVPVYLSLLSIIPGMAVFFVKLETDFAEEMSFFLKSVLKKAPYSTIRDSNRRLYDIAQYGIALQVKVQALATGIQFVCAERILRVLGLTAIQTNIYQITLIGMFCLGIFMSLLSYLFYINHFKEAAICCITFFSLNLIFSIHNILAGARWYGLGFSVAALVSVALGFIFLNKSITKLSYTMFAENVVGGQSKG